MHTTRALLYLTMIAALATTLTACDNDSDSETNPTPDPLAGCVRQTLEPDHQLFGPPAGAAVNAQTGAIEPPAGAIVATTYLALKPDAQARFMEVVGPVQADLQQRAQTGELLAITTANSTQCGTARTLTVWKDEQAMMDFATGAAHTAAIQATGELSRGGSVTMTWTHDGGAVTWDSAAAQLKAHSGPVY